MRLHMHIYVVMSIICVQNKMQLAIYGFKYMFIYAYSYELCAVYADLCDQICRVTQTIIYLLILSCIILVLSCSSVLIK